MKNTSKFQIVFMGVLGAAVVFALLIFSGVIPLGKAKTAQTVGSGSVTIWGTLPFTALTTPIDTLKRTVKSFNIIYLQKSKDTIEQQLIEKLASGTGPDMVIFSQDQLLRFRDKISPIPYTTIPQATFISTFVDEGKLFLSSTGALGLPMVVDPLVMYYNQNIFNTAGISVPPATWTDIVTKTIPLLTKQQVGNSSVLTQNAVALGTFTNITNAKDILSALFLQSNVVPVYQAGTQMVTAFSRQDTSLGSDKALAFYTSFVDPTKSAYSWNQSEKSSRDSFTGEKLAIYFGYASELSGISKSNPNLSFSVAKFPQSDTSKINATYGKMYGISVLKSSKNPTTAIIAAQYMSQSTFVTDVTNTLHIAPARRDLLAVSGATVYQQIFNQSALIARGWLDPDVGDTDTAFHDTIDSVLRGAETPVQAIQTLGKKIDVILKTLPAMVL
jgi:ABC-type glycerol-3-phosphate transport system substrate-binding protein